MSRRAPPPLLCATAFLSGAAAVSYQILWIRRLGELFGQSVLAAHTVLAVFFAGMGVGAWIGGRIADRTRGRIELFLALEVVIALCGLAFLPAAARVEAFYDFLAPSAWSTGHAVATKAALSAVLLAIPTIAMGATLPALLRFAVRSSEALASRLGWLYGANTLGAAAAALSAVFVLLPELGLRRGLQAAAALNVLAALVALAASRARSPAPTIERPRPAEPPLPLRGTVLLLSAAAISGFSSIGLEVLWTRALTARFASTVYSFAAILFAFLLALGLGSLAVAALDRAGLVRRSTLAIAFAAAGLFGLLSATQLTHLAPDPLSADFGAAFLGELQGALWVMALPVAAFGAILPLVVVLVHRDASGVGRDLGRVFLTNTLGAVAAPIAFGFVLLPAIGMRSSLLLAGWIPLLFGILVIAPWAATPGGRVTGRRTGFQVITLAAGLLASLLPGDLRSWRRGEQDVLVAYEEGVSVSVAVVDEISGDRVLKLNNEYRLGTRRTRFAQERQGWIPLLLHDDPRRCLFLGVGTGSSSAAALRYGGLSVDLLEIVPEVFGMLPWFSDINADLARRAEQDPRVRLLAVDARHFVRTTDQHYDVIIGDLFVPWRAGEGAMFAAEHFAAVRETLSPGGLFCQWLPLYQLRPSELRTITATFCSEFPEVWMAWLYFNARQPVVGLFGFKEKRRLDLDALDRRITSGPMVEALARSGLDRSELLAGSFLAGRAALEAFTGGSRRETNDRPQVEFEAAWGRRDEVAPAEENLPLLLELSEPLDRSVGAHGSGLERSERVRRSLLHFFRGSGGPESELTLHLALAWEEAPEWGWIGAQLEQATKAAVDARDWRAARRGARGLCSVPETTHIGHHVLALSALAEGDREAAIAEARKALTLRGDHEPSRELLERLLEEN